jgi:putative drug exporter of the RND superfamily
LVLRAPRAVVTAAVVFAVLGAVAGSLLFGKLTFGGWSAPASGSGRAAAILAADFRQGAPNLTLVVTAPQGVTAAAAEGTALTRQLAAEPGVVGVTSYWTSGQSLLRSKDGKQALILATIVGDESAVDKRYAQLLPQYQGNRDGLQVQAGGFAAFEHDLNIQAQDSVETGELIAFPVTLVALVLVFGSLATAMLPLVVGMITVLLCLGVLWILATVTSLSSLSVSVVTLLGLGLAIDYSLLTVHRYREELQGGLSRTDAVTATIRSVGRTIAFSALMVTVASSGVVWFPLQAVRSMGYAAMATAPLAALTSLTVLPATILMLGPRVDRRMLRRRGTVSRGTVSPDGARAGAESEAGFWHRLAVLVMRRPLRIGIPVVIVLLLLGAPILGMKLGMPDERVLPGGAVPRQVAQTISADFPGSVEGAIQVVSTGPVADPSALPGYAASLSRLGDVESVTTTTGSYADGAQVATGGAADSQFASGQAVYLSVIPASGDPVRAEQLVGQIRAIHPPFNVVVGGVPAANVDAVAVTEHWLPYALTWVAVVILILLVVMTGSVVLPLEALILSVLSLTATFGALVWIFQDGHLSGILDFTATGQISVTVPILLFALSFGLAMDYQVFLLARIREEYRRSGDPTAAVAAGLERIGRIVTAAAILISIVFLAFLASGISLDKAFGIGLPLAVLLDATLVRGALLPATMRLTGRLAWWGPGTGWRLTRQADPSREPVGVLLGSSDDPQSVG